MPGGEVLSLGNGMASGARSAGLGSAALPACAERGSIRLRTGCRSLSVNPRYGTDVRSGISASRLERNRNHGSAFVPQFAGASKFPQLVGGLAKFDRYVARIPILRNLGDCVLLRFERLSE